MHKADVRSRSGKVNRFWALIDAAWWMIEIFVIVVINDGRVLDL
jgi:hypothetical protein